MCIVIKLIIVLYYGVYVHYPPLGVFSLRVSGGRGKERR